MILEQKTVLTVVFFANVKSFAVFALNPSGVLKSKEKQKWYLYLIFPAVGVGLSTVGIAVANAFSGTSVFGNASFNGSFNPASPPAPSAPTAGAAQPASGGSGGVFGVIKDFFKGVICKFERDAYR